MPSGSYIDLRFPSRSRRFVRILVTASAAALFGVAAGGASVFAIVTALEPASAPRSVPENGATEPIGPVVANVAKPALMACSVCLGQLDATRGTTSATIDSGFQSDTDF